MRELFIYYRVRPNMAEAAQSAVFAMQHALCTAHDRLDARLLKRTDGATASETWMEIYSTRLGGGARSGSAIDDVLEARIADAAAVLLPFIDGDRHVERFETLDPS